MAELYPYSFAGLARRMFRELEEADSIFDLPRKRFFLGSPEHDYSRTFHGLRAGSPFGPAAGPQSQLAQNIVLSWLGGGRIMELKTVQVMDELEIPRPCIDMATVGYNVEWSQELKLEQSLDEYVKGAMLIEMLRASGKLDVVGGFEDTLYDMSVGYDLAGIKSPTVQAFLDGMQDPGACIDRLRAEVPAEYGDLRDVVVPTPLSRTLTLSTFHGCPPDEIESIIDFLLKERGLHCIVKLNPTLLGPQRCRALINDALGYEDVVIPESAFENDTSWQQAVDFVGRLGATADDLGLGFGVKFSNTLIVENHRDFFPQKEEVMYLSGPPLHVLAMNLAQQFRGTFGDRYPISFSAGIDRKNFTDAAALGLRPITVCSDLLQPGGYGRSQGYFKELNRRMDAVGAQDLDEFALRAFGNGAAALDDLGLPADDPAHVACAAALDSGASLRQAAGEPLFSRWVSAVFLRNTDSYVPTLETDARYHLAQNQKPPKKIDSTLEFFDCITCDKCIPVCPNDANFTFDLAAQEIPIRKLTHIDGQWVERQEGLVTVAQKHQIANFADFCNECGNCDIFCPEHGGPYVLKPRFFGSLAAWERFPDHDGFYFEPVQDNSSTVHARFEKRVYTLVGDRVFRGPGFEVTQGVGDDAPSITADVAVEIDLTYRDLIVTVRDAVLQSAAPNYLNCL
ncbi:MAG: 4Fe-4S dicluster domain-containing protein [Planctomycetota bacterium]